MVNRYAYPRYGSETYFLDLCQLLREKGHKVIIFTTKDERNVDKEYEDYFINKIDVDNLDSIALSDKILYVLKTIYSFEAKRKIERLIRDTQPDIVHIHNIKRLISPSILHSIKKFGIPVVYTLHDYHLICPNYRLFSKGKICEDCKVNRYYKAIFKRCIRGSFSLSLLACIEQYAHRMMDVFNKNVDMFISPSNFLQEKMIEYGMSQSRIIHILPFIFFDNYQPSYEFTNYIVYAGRLVQEKGLTALIMAMKELPSIRLLIIGEGRYRRELEALVNNQGVSSNVEFKDYMSKENLKSIIRNAMFVVVPSELYEVCPTVVIETFNIGKLVLGANIGGISELIDDGINGLLFRPGDIGDLGEKIKYLFNHKEKIKEMEEKARQTAEEKYNSDLHYEKIIQVYEDLLAK